MVKPSRKKTVLQQVPQQGEIVWFDFDPQSGHEQAGRRPAVVISQTAYNQKIGRAFVCPITSKIKQYPFEVPVQVGAIQGVALADHMKNADWKTRKAQCTGLFVSPQVLEQIWQLIESVR